MSKAVQLFMASDKYNIRHSLLHCVRALKAHLNLSTLPALLALADRHQCLALQQVRLAFSAFLPLSVCMTECIWGSSLCVACTSLVTASCVVEISHAICLLAQAMT